MDSLFLFKKQFASNTNFDFYVGRKVWMPEKYIDICRFNEKDVVRHRLVQDIIKAYERNEEAKRRQ